MTQPTATDPGAFDFDLEIRKLIAEELEGETVEGVKDLLFDLPKIDRIDFDPCWEVGQFVPRGEKGNSGETLFSDVRIDAIFDGELPGELRVYGHRQDWGVCFLYVVSRVGAAGTKSSMSRKGYVRTVADEYVELLAPEEEDEPEAAPPKAN